MNTSKESFIKRSDSICQRRKSGSCDWVPPPASDRPIKTYATSGEPLKCAGCFALEGRGGLFVEKLAGCHTNVIGLSLPLLRQMLDQLGYHITDFWQFPAER